jgi:hypothetical protein
MEREVVSAREVLNAVRAAGVRVVVDGNDLILEAPTQPSAMLLDMLARDKAAIVALLGPGADGWKADDWRAFFDQRRTAATRGGRVSRTDAEARAFNCCVVEWLNRHPIRSSADRCSWCGGMERDDNVLLPFGIESSGHAWLHSECWAPWRDCREREAVAALAGLGVRPNSR